MSRLRPFARHAFSAGAATLVLAVGVGAGVSFASSGPNTPTSPVTKGVKAVAPAATHAARSTPATTITPLRPSPTEDHFVAITPCRVVDTRVAGGKLAAKSTRNFYVAGTTGFSAQGGSATGCGIPVGATAVALSVISIDPPGGGHLTLWPSGSTEPLASLLNYQAKQTDNTAGTVTIASATTQQLSVYTSNGPVNVVIDVFGYYTDQIEAYVRLSVTPPYIYSGTSHILSVTNPSTGQAVLTLDRTVEQCAVTITPASDNQYASGYTVGNEVIVTTWYLDPTTHAEVKANIDFNLMVSC